MPRRSILLFAGACIAVAVAVAVSAIVVVSGRDDTGSASRQIGATGQPDVGGPFQLVNQEGQPVDQTLIVFITVDPERDTPQALKDYLSSDGFPPGVIGLTGAPAQVRAAADAYRAVYQKVGEDEAYTMNHSLTVYLMGPDGRFRSALGHDLGPVNSARVIEQAMARG
jgi:protein SCO1/2